jgi:hypothetical protein
MPGGFFYVEDVFLAALMERLGLGGREMTASGHSKWSIAQKTMVDR